MSAPEASTSGTMYSSLRVLLPPKARPLLHVLALGPHLGAAEVAAQSLQVMDGTGPEGQPVAGEVVEPQGRPLVEVVAHRMRSISKSTRRTRSRTGYLHFGSLTGADSPARHDAIAAAREAGDAERAADLTLAPAPDLGVPSPPRGRTTRPALDGRFGFDLPHLRRGGPSGSVVGIPRRRFRWRSMISGSAASPSPAWRR